MTQYNLEKQLKKQLEALNEIIDRKIVRGVSYSKEAREHKYVLTRLSNLRRSRMHWMVRPFSPLITI